MFRGVQPSELTFSVHEVDGVHCQWVQAHQDLSAYKVEVPADDVGYVIFTDAIAQPQVWRPCFSTTRVT